MSDDDDEMENEDESNSNEPTKSQSNPQNEQTDAVDEDIDADEDEEEDETGALPSSQKNPAVGTLLYSTSDDDEEDEEEEQMNVRTNLRRRRVKETKKENVKANVQENANEKADSEGGDSEATMDEFKFGVETANMNANSNRNTKKEQTSNLFPYFDLNQYSTNQVIANVYKINKNKTFRTSTLTKMNKWTKHLQKLIDQLVEKVANGSRDIYIVNGLFLSDVSFFGQNELHGTHEASRASMIFVGYLFDLSFKIYKLYSRFELKRIKTKRFNIPKTVWQWHLQYLIANNHSHKNIYCGNESEHVKYLNNMSHFLFEAINILSASMPSIQVSMDRLRHWFIDTWFKLILKAYNQVKQTGQINKDTFEQIDDEKNVELMNSMLTLLSRYLRILFKGLIGKYTEIANGCSINVDQFQRMSSQLCFNDAASVPDRSLMYYAGQCLKFLNFMAMSYVHLAIDIVWCRGVVIVAEECAKLWDVLEDVKFECDTQWNQIYDQEINRHQVTGQLVNLAVLTGQSICRKNRDYPWDHKKNEKESSRNYTSLTQYDVELCLRWHRNYVQSFRNVNKNVKSEETKMENETADEEPPLKKRKLNTGESQDASANKSKDKSNDNLREDSQVIPIEFPKDSDDDDDEEEEEDEDMDAAAVNADNLFATNEDPDDEDY